MNIHALSAYQRGEFNPNTNRWEGINLYQEYIRYCLRRRSYKRKQGKGLTRSEIGILKQLVKTVIYLEKLLKRQPSASSLMLDDLAEQYTHLVLEEMKRKKKPPGALYRFFSKLFNKIFSRKAASAA